MLDFARPGVPHLAFEMWVFKPPQYCHPERSRGTCFCLCDQREPREARFAVRAALTQQRRLFHIPRPDNPVHGIRRALVRRMIMPHLQLAQQSNPDHLDPRQY